MRGAQHLWLSIVKWMLLAILGLGRRIDKIGQWSITQFRQDMYCKSCAPGSWSSADPTNINHVQWIQHGDCLLKLSTLHYPRKSDFCSTQIRNISVILCYPLRNCRQHRVRCSYLLFVCFFDECGSFKMAQIISEIRLMTADSFCFLCVIKLIFNVGVCSIFAELNDLHFSIR